MRLRPDDSPLASAAKALATPSWHLGSARQTLASLRAPRDVFDHGNNAPTVLLVHGFLTRPGCLSAAGERLAERFNVAYAPVFPHWNTGSVAGSAALLRRKIRMILCEREKNGDLSVVAHSLGGLIALEALKESVRVRTLATLATPFGGSPQARLAAPFSAGARDIGDWGRNAAPWADKPMDRLECHVSGQDSVVPPENQLPPPWMEPDAVVRHEGFQHFDFLLGPKAAAFADGLLRDA